MALPLFYSAEITEQDEQHVLSEESSKHIVQVLRMKKEEELSITNGNGYMFITKIIDDHKKRVALQVLDKSLHPAKATISIGISLVKNVQRFEWFLEKAVEIGISEIFPLICARTEKHHFRTDRLKGIMVSAMLQSQQPWLPLLHQPQSFNHVINRPLEGNAFIAHCLADEKRRSLQHFSPLKNPIILIGPEGDFTKDEIYQALEKKFQPVSLGNTRLRTETAGMVAVTLLNNLNGHLRD